MAKPLLHAESSARKYGGTADDYIEIHNMLDLSKGALPDNRHRALTHTSWFLSNVLERIFGVYIVNSENKKVSVRDIGEQHCLEDFGFIPTAQDFLEEIEYKPWMSGRAHGFPPSQRKAAEAWQKKRVKRKDDSD